MYWCYRCNPIDYIRVPTYIPDVQMMILLNYIGSIMDVHTHEVNFFAVPYIVGAKHIIIWLSKYDFSADCLYNTM